MLNIFAMILKNKRSISVKCIIILALLSLALLQNKVITSIQNSGCKTDNSMCVILPDAFST